MFAVVVLFCFCGVFIRGFPVEDEESLKIDLSYLGDRIYYMPSGETGKLLESWDPKSGVNPEELGEYAEGDIYFPSWSRNGLISQSFRWKNGVVPYEIEDSYSSSERSFIESVMGIFHKYTCIKFRPKTALDQDYISIVKGPSGCRSSIGRIIGRQEIHLHSGCLRDVGTPLHELMHAVGFLHEQNRFERDDYVRIVWENIKSNHSHNFDKAPKGQTDDFGVPYDYNSVMHYSKKAFSINGQPTIIPIVCSYVVSSDIKSNKIDRSGIDKSTANLIESLRHQIKTKEEELQKAEKVNKNFEKMIQLVNILGQVDSFLTDRTKTMIKKLAVLADDKDGDKIM